MTKLIDRLKSLFHSGEHFIVTLGKRELKIALTSPLGQSVSAALSAGEAGATPAEKMALALASFLPVLKTYIESPSTLESDLETAARLILEDALAQVKTTGPLAIFEALVAAAS